MKIILEEGDNVKLPFKEEGIITKIQELVWMTKYFVKITVSNGFNEVGDEVDYFKRDLEYKF